MPLLWLSLAFWVDIVWRLTGLAGKDLVGACLAWPWPSRLSFVSCPVPVFSLVSRRVHSHPLLASLAPPLPYTILFAALALGAARYQSSKRR